MNQILILSVVYILLSCLYFWKCLLVVTTEIVPQFDFDPVPSNKNFKWCWQVLLTTISWDSCKPDQTPSNNERLFVYYSTSVALLGACLLCLKTKQLSMCFMIEINPSQTNSENHFNLLRWFLMVQYLLL